MTNTETIYTELVKFSSNPWFGWITFVLGTIIAVISIVIAIKSRRLKIPVYATRTFNLIQEKIQKINSIQIKYKDSHIDNFSISRVALWNNGKETINRSDIASSDKLRIISIGNVKLLDAQIIFEKNKVNNFSLNLENIEKEILINFDFFDFEEGIIIQVFHTGKEGSDIEINGTIKGFGSIKRDFPKFIYIFEKPADFIEKLYKKYKKVFLGVFSILLPFLILLSEIKPKIESKNIFISRYLLVVVSAFMYWPLAYLILHRRVPKGFELFEEEIKLSKDTPLIK